MAWQKRDELFPFASNMHACCHAGKPASTAPIHLKSRKSKFIHEAHDELRVLEHVLDANVLNSVIGAVDVGAAVVVVSLEDEGGWVPVASGGRVVGASVATGSLNIANVAVLIVRKGLARLLRPTIESGIELGNLRRR